jgi:hypothetical protein
MIQLLSTLQKEVWAVINHLAGPTDDLPNLGKCFGTCWFCLFLWKEFEVIKKSNNVWTTG